MWAAQKPYYNAELLEDNTTNVAIEMHGMACEHVILRSCSVNGAEITAIFTHIAQQALSQLLGRELP